MLWLLLLLLVVRICFGPYHARPPNEDDKSGQTCWRPSSVKFKWGPPLTMDWSASWLSERARLYETRQQTSAPRRQLAQYVA